MASSAPRVSSGRVGATARVAPERVQRRDEGQQERAGVRERGHEGVRRHDDADAGSDAEQRGAPAPHGSAAHGTSATRALGRRSPLISSTLRRSGELAGRLEGDCVGLDARYEAFDCALTLILRDGLLTAKDAGTSKPVPGVGRTTEQYAITGGTGAYAGAAGTIRRAGDGDRDTLTVTFSP